MIKIIIRKLQYIHSFRWIVIWLYINFTFVLSCILRLFFGIEKNKVVFIANVGKYYSCNPKYISEALHEINPNIKIVWLFNNPDEKKRILPDYIIPIRNKTLRAFYELSTAKCWIDNCLKKFYKSKEQFYIQTWHGDRGFKAGGKLNPNYKNNNKPIETRQIDCFTSGSEHFSKFVEMAYGYKGLILKYGCPRNDILVNQNTLQSNNIKKKLGLDDEKILLYAPTFRKESFVKSNQNSDIDFNFIIKKLEEVTYNKWILLYRAHPNLKSIHLEKCEIKHVDVTSYENMNELLLISDLLITDYSSSAGDFALTGKSIILYQPDASTYVNEHGFTDDFTKSPYYISYSKKELEELICNYNNLEPVKNDMDILDFYQTHESGNASIKVAELIIEKIGLKSEERM